jgi:hypothetical protein
MMARVLFLFAILSLFSACDLRSERDVPPRPEQMIGRHDFVSIHAQLQLLEAAHRQHMLKGDRERSRALHKDRVLREAGISDSAFTATFNWWYSQPEVLPELLQEVQTHLDSLARNSPWN